MRLLSKLPIADSIVSPGDMARVEEAFAEACSEAGVDPGSVEAEKIGITVLADYAIGVLSTPPSAV